MRGTEYCDDDDYDVCNVFISAFGRPSKLSLGLSAVRKRE